MCGCFQQSCNSKPEKDTDDIATLTSAKRILIELFHSFCYANLVLCGNKM